MFTGRERILEDIQNFFNSKERLQKRLILTGLGGVGKTQIATAFAYQTFESKRFSTIFWIFSDSRETILRSFSDIAKKLGVTNAGNSGLDQTQDIDSREETPIHVNAVLHWLTAQQNHEWLLIFDNLDDLEPLDVLEFMPNLPVGNIMITSRRQAAARYGEQIEIGVMGKDEAIDLLSRCARLPSNTKPLPLGCLVEELGRLPLALDQAGAYIAEQGIDVETYLRLFNVNRNHVLGHKPPKAVWLYEETVYTTWELSYAKVKLLCPLAAKVLDISAYFQSDDIPLELVVNLATGPINTEGIFLEKFIPGISSKADYDQIFGTVPSEFVTTESELLMAVGRLLSFSLVRRKPGSQSLQMHPLVHAWVKDRKTDIDVQIQDCRAGICLVYRALFNACDLCRFGDASILYSQSFICSVHLLSMPQLLGLINGPVLGACIIAVAAWVSMSPDQGTLERSDRLFDLIHSHQWKSSWKIPQGLMINRATLRLLSRGLYKKLEEMSEEFLQNYVPSTRQEKMYLSCIVQTYAPCLYRQLRYYRAEEVLGMSDTSCDASGYFQARKDLTLGGIWLDTGRLKDSEMALQSCRDVLMRRVGPQHYYVSVSIQLSSLCFIAQGRYAEAEALMSPLIEARLADPRQMVANFTFADYELAEVYSRALRMQGKHVEALNLLNTLLESTRSAMPPPARALGELSLLIAYLDLETSTESLSKRTITRLFEEVECVFRRAELAYKFEWTRGTWVFKFFDTTMKDFRMRLEDRGSIHSIQDDTVENP